MKASLIGILAAAVLALPAPLDGAGIEGSKHDFRSRASNLAPQQDSRDVCVFCHSPSGRADGAEAPLWSRGEGPPEYQRFATFGTANQEAGRATVGSVSLACLSCHDGTQAVDVAFNAAALQPIGNRTASPFGLLDFAGRPPTVFLAGGLGRDHPVGVPYAGGICDGAAADCDPRGGNFGRQDFRTARHAVINAVDHWWVDTAVGETGYREKTDMILYSRDGGGSVGPYVECGSCHDPHEGDRRPVSFLRVPNRNSGLCLSCHVK